MRLLPVSPLPLLGCLAVLALFSLLFSGRTRASSVERSVRRALPRPAAVLPPVR